MQNTLSPAFPSTVALKILAKMGNGKTPNEIEKAKSKIVNIK